MQLQDALFNWLQIDLVKKARPSDRSAQDTVLFFEKILQEDHQVSNIQQERDSGQYRVFFMHNGEEKSCTFPRETAEKLLTDLLSEPKYQQSFE